MDVDNIVDIVTLHGFNVTLTGGDPLLSPDPDTLLNLVKRIKAHGLTVWCYTGYTFESLTEHPELKPLIDEFEAIVDGPFIMAERDSSLPFRGSRNQRILRPDGSDYPL